jgi:hypothetical protein
MLSTLLGEDAAGATNALSVGAQLKASAELRSNWTRRIIFFNRFLLPRRKDFHIF